MGAQTREKPTLWQIEVSHYSEKVRWALEYKGVDHVRRTPLPGMHIPIALAMTRGASPTFPIVTMDGRTLADSTEIIAALEQRFPDPPLYPADPEDRRRALELEDYFDEQLGPHARLLPFYELTQEPELFAEVAAESVPGPLGKVKPVVGAYARAYTSARWGAASDEGAERARAGILAAMDRLDAELAASGGEYLAGGDFSVADLTAASLFYPVVIPAEGPLSPEQPRPPAYERFRESIADRPGFRWVEEMFKRHRRH
ncbi:MAG TPA: glutathione S-transferase family protein [Solirubrobacterales bacterium]|nr:glutathione S-transferase family protein [Solirubrobacterales bacterium]